MENLVRDEKYRFVLFRSIDTYQLNWVKGEMGGRREDWNEAIHINCMVFVLLIITASNGNCTQWIT